MQTCYFFCVKLKKLRTLSILVLNTDPVETTF